jgi:dienelactone hydrolase
LNMNITEFFIETSNERLRCSLASPKQMSLGEKSGLLLNLRTTKEIALCDPRQNHPTEPFLKAGHYVLSFDLPHHGERVKQYGDNLVGMARAFMAGDDPFEQFIANGRAALDTCLKNGIGTHGKIVAYGVSRSAYCCLRLAAADKRIHAVAGLSPVTDWKIPTEFAELCEDSRLEQINIDHWIDQLADRAVYLCIGSQDDLVGTNSCARFAMKLFDKQRQILPEGTFFNQFHVVDCPGHSTTNYWRLNATHYLLQFCEQVT